MSEPVYQWKRFWYPQGDPADLSDGGYLRDPDISRRFSYAPQPASSEALFEAPCLVLLGEPGIGKSTALKAFQAHTERQIAATDERLLPVNLADCPTDNTLYRKLFDHPILQRWKEESFRLHLFLDSLDETLMPVATVGRMLVDEFQNYRAERLLLRIACRSADWPEVSLGEQLKLQWGKQAVHIYELAPLRRLDVAEAATANGFDREAFLQAIDQADVVPLAIKPITLRSLLDTFRHGGGRFPDTKAELHEKGYCELCKEQNPYRREAGMVGVYTAEQRLSAAKRIAAITIFTKRATIWTDRIHGDVMPEDITVQSLMSSADGQSPFPKPLIEEALSTALFSSRGPGRLGWAHQTYPEYLAVQYLTEHQVTLPQILSFITSGDDYENRIVPQLREVTARLCSVRPDVYEFVLRHDPKVLLRSDLSSLRSEQRKDLVDALLASLQRDEHQETSDIIISSLRRLTHPDLAEQLRAYFRSATNNTSVRRLATDIAEACALMELGSDLVTVALNNDEPYPLRVDATSTAARIGSPDDKDALKAVLAPGIDDPSDELKGAVLRGLWPTSISAADLFATLAPPRNPEALTQYWMFIEHELAQHLRPEHLPVALDWVEQQSLEPEEPIWQALDHLAGSIFLRAWEHLDDPATLVAFAQIFLVRMRRRGGIFGEAIGIDRAARETFYQAFAEAQSTRRKVAKLVIALLTDEPDEGGWLVASIPSLLNLNDLEWLIAQLEQTANPGDRKVIARIICRLYNPESTDYLNLVYQASERFPDLANYWTPLFKPIPLDSPYAHSLRREDEERRKAVQEKADTEAQRQAIAQRLEPWLEKIEAGETIEWWRLNDLMRRGPNGKPTHFDHETDLTLLPGWEWSDEATRRRIILAAVEYLKTQESHPEEWLGKSVRSLPAYAGYRALRLIQRVIPDQINNLPAHVWQRWAPIIVAMHSHSNSSDAPQLHRKLVAQAYKNAPAITIEHLLYSIDNENRIHGAVFILNNFDLCWDEQFAQVLLDKLADETLTSASMHIILEQLFTHEVPEARTYAEKLVVTPSPQEQTARKRAIFAAWLLFKQTNDSAWDVLWPIFQHDPEFGKEVVTLLAAKPSRQTHGSQLTEEQLADLSIWLERQFPYEKEVFAIGSRDLTDRDHIEMWKQSLLTHLQTRGTPAAIQSIQRIIRELPDPDLTWLQRLLAGAREQAQRSTWVPLNADEIIKLVENSKLRSIQDVHRPNAKDKDNLSDYLYQDLAATADLELHLILLGDGLVLTLRYTRPSDSGEDLTDPFPVQLDEQRLLRALGIGVNAYGAELTKQLFADQTARQGFISRCDSALEAGYSLRVRLHLSAPGLHALRWELLHDPTTQRPLALDSRLLVTRYVSAKQRGKVSLRPRGDLRALIAVAAPTNLDTFKLAPIDPTAEIARVRAALKDIGVDTLPAGKVSTLNALGNALCSGAGYDILYMVAHGSYTYSVPQLYLEDASGKVVVTDGNTFTELIRNLDDHHLPRLIVLASCESAGNSYADALAALGPLLAQAGMPAVLAMQGKVQMATVERFAPVFFSELLRDGLADRALAVARLAVQDCPDWWMPVLYTRLREGRVWEQGSASVVSPAVHIIKTDGGDYAEGNIDKRQGIFAQVIHIHESPPLPLIPTVSAAMPDPRQAIPTYLARLQSELAHTDVVPIPNAYAWADTRAYVPLQVRSDAAAEPAFAALTNHDASKRPSGLLLVGEAGSGKSHTLRYAALVLAHTWPMIPPELRNDLGLDVSEPLLPIYVSLQDLPRCRAELYRAEPDKQPTLLRLIDYHLCRLASDAEPLPSTLFRSLVATSGQPCLFMLDGLDEIDDHRERHDIQQALVALQLERPEHMYVVTSRPLPDISLSAAGFVERRLAPLQPDQMRNILVHWHRTEYGRGPLSPEVEHRIATQADSLLATILGDPDLAPMAPNPLFLTAMARMALSQLRLPRLRVQKYKQIVDLLLEWRRNRLQIEDRTSLFAEIPHRAALGRLAELAACMLALGREELTLEAFVHGACLDVLPDRDLQDKPDADVLERLLWSVVRHTGLLTEQRGLYRFTYGFRDYLAAQALACSADMADRLFEKRAETGWRTTIMLAIGYQATNNPRILKSLFSRLLADGEESTILAAEALCEALDGRVPELEPERRQLLTRLREMGANNELIHRLEPLDE